MYTFIYFNSLVSSYVKNNFHKKLQFCEGGTILNNFLMYYLFYTYKPEVANVTEFKMKTTGAALDKAFPLDDHPSIKIVAHP